MIFGHRDIMTSRRHDVNNTESTGGCPGGSKQQHRRVATLTSLLMSVPPCRCVILLPCLAPRLSNASELLKTAIACLRTPDAVVGWPEPQMARQHRKCISCRFAQRTRDLASWVTSFANSAEHALPWA
jgi:hypothetical protein